MQKKIAAMLKYDTSDIQKEMTKANAQLIQKFDGVLKQAFEQYLGRSIDMKADKDRFSSVSVQGSNETQYFVDGVLIGVMKLEFGWANDDFINDEVSGRITFTPNHIMCAECWLNDRGIKCVCGNPVK